MNLARSHVFSCVSLFLTAPCIAQFGSPQPIFDGRVRYPVGADLDGDGDQDLLRGDGWLENLGGGQFQLVTGFPWVGNSFPVDLDGDGDPDVLELNANLGVRSHENLGLGQFGPAQLIDFKTIHGVTPADIDLDGDVDLPVITTALDFVGWYENDGGTFELHVVSNLAVSLRTLLVDDVDGDGDPDLVTADTGGGAVLWYPNLGAGAFGVPQFVSFTVPGPSGVALLDLDDDGDLDAVVAMGSMDQLFRVENLGAGSFGTPVDLPTSSGGDDFAVYAADVDGDGDRDLLVEPDSYGVPAFPRLWRENISPGLLGPEQVIEDPIWGSGLGWLDLEGDGDLDLVGSDRQIPTSFRTVVYENLHELGQSFCVAAVNSTGQGAEITGKGSRSIAANGLVLEASPVPIQGFGLFYYGPDQTQMPFGDGFRCVAPGTLGVYRLPVTNSGAAGVLRWSVDNAAPPVASGQLTAASTWYFQAWYRDPAGAGSGFNLSDGLCLDFVE